MLQSCETLIIKINEWQKAVLELDGLSDEFLSSGDGKIKERIDNQKNEIEKLGQEYLGLMHQKLPYGQFLFWPEKELIENFLEQMITKVSLKEAINRGMFSAKDNHIVRVKLKGNDLSIFSSLDFSLFNKLEVFWATSSNLKVFPKLYKSIKKVDVFDNPNIVIPDDMTYFENLEVFGASDNNLYKIPRFADSIKSIDMRDNPDIPEKEKERIKKEHPNTKILF